MAKPPNLSRRTFLQSLGITGTTVMMGGVVPAQWHVVAASTDGTQAVFGKRLPKGTITFSNVHTKHSELVRRLVDDADRRGWTPGHFKLLSRLYGLNGPP